MKFGKKSDLLKCLTFEDDAEPPSRYDCKVIDGAAIIHALRPNAVKTFNEYADQQFIPYLQRQLQFCRRIDVVFDTYIQDSVKESARQKRGQGIRRKVTPGTAIPGDWMKFLRHSRNKMELFSPLADKVNSTAKFKTVNTFISLWGRK